MFITYENGSVIEGNVTDLLIGWGYIIGTTENSEMKVPLDRSHTQNSTEGVGATVGTPVDTAPTQNML